MYGEGVHRSEQSSPVRQTHKIIQKVSAHTNLRIRKTQNLEIYQNLKDCWSFPERVQNVSKPGEFAKSQKNTYNMNLF